MENDAILRAKKEKILLWENEEIEKKNKEAKWGKDKRESVKTIMFEQNRNNKHLN